eukprot:442665_1
MGNKHTRNNEPKKQPSTVVKESTIQQLINMGFDEQMSVNAFGKYSNDINKCIEWINAQNNQRQKPERKQNEPVQNFIPSDYINRINKVLDIQKKLLCNSNNTEQKADAYDMICSIYPDTNINYFLLDYEKYVRNIDSNKIYCQNIGTCDLPSCTHIAREYRNRNIYDINDKQRYKLYNHCKTEKSIVINQIIDQIHIVKYHLIDLQLRYISKAARSENQDEKHDNNHQQLSIMRNEILTRRSIFNKIRGDLPSNDTQKQPNKFMTEILDDAKQQGDIHAQYSFGFRYYYHDYYKNNRNRQEMVPGCTFPDECNVLIQKDYKYCDWYIAPKYTSMKVELLEGTHPILSMIQYNNTYIKASMKHSAYKKNMRVAGKTWQIAYGIKKRSVIQLRHVFAVMLYTNHTDLSYLFSKTFRKISSNETDTAIKVRHSNYAHLGKALREAVEVWRTAEDDEIKVYYHGISRQILFTGFDKRFAGPTSTTLHYSTAVMFATRGNVNDGIVITIENARSGPFFNCVPFSDFPGEDERLTVGGIFPLMVRGLTVIGNKTQKYDHWIRALIAFESAIKGGYSTKRITRADKINVEILVNNFLKKEHSQVSIPAYVGKLFEHLVIQMKTLQIDFDRLEKDILWVEDDPSYGFKLLSHLFIGEERQIKWNVLIDLFPNAWGINVICTEKIPNTVHGYKFAPSMLIDDCALETILLYLSNGNAKYTYIGIHYPQNNMNSLKELIRTHLQAYKEQHFSLKIVQTNHPQHGSCSAIKIVPL